MVGSLRITTSATRVLSAIGQRVQILDQLHQLPANSPDSSTRTDHWADHFSLHGVVVEPRTPIGEVTVRLLGYNEPDRILEREAIRDIGRYPPKEAMERLTKK